MQELYEKLDNVILELEKLELFKNIDASIEKINNNVELVSKINKYNTTKDESLRLDIYNYQEIKEYKMYENEANILILQINNKLKKINNNRRVCCNANH